MWAIGAPSGQSRSAVTRIVLLAISVATVAGAAKLWSKWRAGLAVGLVFHAFWYFYLGSQITPDQQTKVGSGRISLPRQCFSSSPRSRTFMAHQSVFASLRRSRFETDESLRKPLGAGWASFGAAAAFRGTSRERPEGASQNHAVPALGLRRGLLRLQRPIARNPGFVTRSPRPSWRDDYL
jgi:hypothetical protein